MNSNLDRLKVKNTSRKRSSNNKEVFLPKYPASCLVERGDLTRNSFQALLPSPLNKPINISSKNVKLVGNITSSKVCVLPRSQLSTTIKTSSKPLNVETRKAALQLNYPSLDKYWQ